MTEHHDLDQVNNQSHVRDQAAGELPSEANGSLAGTGPARAATPSAADRTRAVGTSFRPHGPYVSRAAALTDAEYIYALAAGCRPADKINEDALHAALISAAVELGAYDRQVVQWLATCRSQTVLVVLSWVEQAYASGYKAGRQSAYASMRGPQAHYVFDGVTAKCGAIDVPATSNPDDATCPACVFALFQDGGER